MRKRGFGGAAFNGTLDNNDLVVDTNVLFADISTNRVGINTATPNVELEIQSDDSSHAYIRIDAPAGKEAIVQHFDDGVAKWAGGKRTDNKYGIYNHAGTGWAFVIDSSDNVGLNGVESFGASAAGVLAIGNGTAPGAAANMIQLYSYDVSAGNTSIGIRTEGAGAVSSGTTSPTDALEVQINGTTYYIPLDTSAPV